MTSALASWGPFLGWFALEVALFVLAGAALSRLARDPRQQRALWQAALIALLLVLAGEVADLRDRARAWIDSVPKADSISKLLRPAHASLNSIGGVNPSMSSEALKDYHETPVTWPGWVWMFGAIAFLTINGTAQIRLLLERRKMPAADAENYSLAAGLLAALRLPKVEVRFWERAPGPVAFGFWRPTVALPPDFARCFTKGQREVMLAHELAHLAARDPLWSAVMDIMCAVAWWHPLVWWMRRRFRRACEAAADQASALIPSGPATLAESLVVFGRQLSTTGPPHGLGVAGGGFRSEFGARIKALLDDSLKWRDLSPAQRWTPRLIGIFVALLIGVLPAPIGHAGSMFAALVSDLTSENTGAPSQAHADKTPGAQPKESGTSSSQHGNDPIILNVEFYDLTAAQALRLEVLFNSAQTAGPKPQIWSDRDHFPDVGLPDQQPVHPQKSEIQHIVVLNAQQSRALRESLAKDSTADLLADTPDQELHSGVLMSAKASDVMTIFWRGETMNLNTNFQSELVELGPRMNLLPVSTPDGWHFDVWVSCLDFLGYDDASTLPSQLKGDIQIRRTLPSFRIWQTRAGVFARPGQTLVIGGPRIPIAGETLKDIARSSQAPPNSRNGYILVTLTSPAAKPPK